VVRLLQQRHVDRDHVAVLKQEVQLYLEARLVMFLRGELANMYINSAYIFGVWNIFDPVWGRIRVEAEHFGHQPRKFFNAFLNN
jgi:hypothetical protein